VTKNVPILPGVCLAVLFSMGQCMQKEAMTGIQSRADSLLQLTLGLQAKLGSSDIRRMHDFQEEIEHDLAVLDTIAKGDPSLAPYRELSGKFGRCMKACSQYHEEAYMIESSLREIMDLSGTRDQDPQELKKRLSFETDNYEDLSQRVDSSLNQAMRQAEEYYSIKPGINRLLDQYRLP
jgi:hypothetical protein